MAGSVRVKGYMRKGKRVKGYTRRKATHCNPSSRRRRRR